MQLEKLENILEAVLFAAGEPVAIADIMDSLGVQRSEVLAAAKSLVERYKRGSGLNLVQFSNKLQLGTSREYSEEVKKVLSPIQEKALSISALETVAIIAYNQPITRLEIEQFRGVNCEYAVQILLKHGLIEVSGYKDAIGKPAQFSTTEEFLKRFQIGTIKELPDYAKLLEDIKRINEKRQSQSEAVEEKGLYQREDEPENL